MELEVVSYGGVGRIAELLLPLDSERTFGTKVADETLVVAVARFRVGCIEEEVEATLDVLPAGARQIGFCSYGEISPSATGRCDLHNQTMTLTTIAEA